MGHFHIVCAFMSYGEDIYLFAKCSWIQHLKSLYIKLANQNQCQSEEAMGRGCGKLSTCLRQFSDRQRAAL